jgi:hypothetical protein
MDYRLFYEAKRKEEKPSEELQAAGHDKGNYSPPLFLLFQLSKLESCCRADKALLVSLWYCITALGTVKYLTSHVVINVRALGGPSSRRIIGGLPGTNAL